MTELSVKKLSPRQVRCLQLAAMGETSVQIAHTLGISPRTVDEYIFDACRKLGVHNRTQAVAKAIAIEIIAVDTP